MSFEYVCRAYGVPAKRGARIEYTATDGVKSYGTITSATHYINVRFDGKKFALPLHPTWNVRYLPATLSDPQP